MINSYNGRFVWYELMTTDTAAATAFYISVVGWGAQDASRPGMPYTLFTAGKALVGGLSHLPEDATKMGARPSWIGYVGVNDVDTAADRVGRLGGTVLVPPQDIADISRFAIVADPQRATLALLKWLKPGRESAAVLDAPGHIGWHELLAADWEKALAFYSELFGWQKADSVMSATGTYQLFSAGRQAIGSIFTKPATLPLPFWLYYFNVSDLGAAAERVNAGGGRILHGPVELPSGGAIVQCMDPQDALFALAEQRRHGPPGYFERLTTRDREHPQAKTRG